jgi:hypothetical protein
VARRSKPPISLSGSYAETTPVPDVLALVVISEIIVLAPKAVKAISGNKLRTFAVNLWEVALGAE